MYLTFTSTHNGVYIVEITEKKDELSERVTRDMSLRLLLGAKLYFYKYRVPEGYDITKEQIQKYLYQLRKYLKKRTKMV